jgi:hypothetical protein
MALDFAALQSRTVRSRLRVSQRWRRRRHAAKRFINDAMHAIDDIEDWPYLNASTTGTTPLTISDLGKIESVADASGLSVCRSADAASCRQYATSRPPVSVSEFYVTGGNTINVYPATHGTTLTVTYWKVAPDLVNDSDTPLMPDRFRYAIVEYALAVALRDESAQDAVAAQPPVTRSLRA